jgi:hypothetical protein
MLDLTNLLNQTSLPFRDAEVAKSGREHRCLDPRRAHAALVEVVDSLNLTEHPIRAPKIMELMRDRVAYVQESVTDISPVNLCLCREEPRSMDGQKPCGGMEQGYRYCLRTAANDDEPQSILL